MCVVLFFVLIVYSSHPPHAHAHTHSHTHTRCQWTDKYCRQRSTSCWTSKTILTACSYDCWSLTLTVVAAAITCGMYCAVSCTLSSDHTAKTIVWSHTNTYAYAHQWIYARGTSFWFKWNELTKSKIHTISIRKHATHVYIYYKSTS